ncbi:MAG TPA: DNA mismatch repair endonuclease MutL [Thermoanaerobaculaceae bacterium]|nr:DNA mismatch repair endonuclease MutL [Thermoanaerobaculaceae bacterium]
MAKIHLLPDALINQIAAGEVVERPASVVKELVENSLDAGARSIRVEISEGGREMVAVDDDGCGMDGEDAPLALQRHATSKVSDADDLNRISTLGFRGEALPSMAAASHLTLETAAADGEGTRVEVEFGRVVGVAPCARPRGTRVSVRDLFARLPARRKFLRTEATELRHAVSALTALAFTHPEVAFILEHGKRTLLHLPSVRELTQRLSDLFGARRAREARPVQHAASGVAVSGFLLPPSGSREIVVAVNGRAVRDRLLIGAINRALRGPSGVSEADAYLHVSLPPAEVDVNVHPTKAEVRFADPGRVISALTQGLAVARLALHGPVQVRRVVSVAPSAAEGPRLPLVPYPSGASTGGTPPAVREGFTPEPMREGMQPALTKWGRYIGQYRETYLVLEDGEGLVLIDQHVAHERVLFERLLGTGSKPAVQGLLLPEIVELPPALAVLAAEAAGVFESLGLELEAASGTTVRVVGVPAALPPGRSAEMVRQLLSDLAGGEMPGESLRERAAASLACQSAIKKNRPLSRAEAEHLIVELGQVREPHRCPHGRPIVLALPHSEIERRIGRR